MSHDKQREARHRSPAPVFPRAGPDISEVRAPLLASGCIREADLRLGNPATYLQRLIRHGQHAGAEGRRVHELKTHLTGYLVEETHAGADHDRADIEVELIQQPVAQQRAHQPGAAGDQDVLARLLLEWLYPLYQPPVNLSQIKTLTSKWCGQKYSPE
jgi:hypothetical protein